MTIVPHHPWNDYKLSGLMLGTAQLGMPYGIANAVGKPDFQQAVRLIAAAVESGVNCFDTAAAYGESESVLGRALKELGLVESTVVVTKVRWLSDAELADPRQAALAVEQSVEQSRRHIGLDCLPLVLFHRDIDAAHFEALHDLIHRGWLRCAGVSCGYDPGPALQLLNPSGPRAGTIAAIQSPGSVLDQRHQRAGVFQAAASCGAAVFVRSVYLQGLLLMPEESIPSALQAVVPVRRGLAELAAAAGMSLAELALRYMLGQEGVVCVVVGAETVEQIRANAAMAARGPLPSDLVSAIAAAATDLPDMVINPRLWNKT